MNQIISFRLPETGQRGSIMLMVVFGLGLAITFMLAGIITYNTQYVSSEKKKGVHKYLNDCQARLDKWYDRNAASRRLTYIAYTPYNSTAPGISDDLDEQQIINEIDIRPQYGLRILATNVFESKTQPDGSIYADSLTEEYHQSIRFRKMYCVIVDPTSGASADISNTDSDFFKFDKNKSGHAAIDVALQGGTINPASYSPIWVREDYRDVIRFAMVDGLTIQKNKIGDTITLLTTISKMMEARFKAKFEGDPFHNIGWNHFAPAHPEAPLPDEIPSTHQCACGDSANCDGSGLNYHRKASTVLDGRWTDPTDTGTSGLILSRHQPLGYIEIGSTENCVAPADIGPIRDRMTRVLGGDYPTNDAWGNPIMFSNKIGPDPSSISAPRTGGSGATPYPPYAIPILALTPWGTGVVVNAIQPVN